MPAMLLNSGSVFVWRILPPQKVGEKMKFHRQPDAIASLVKVDLLFGGSFSKYEA